MTSSIHSFSVFADYFQYIVQEDKGRISETGSTKESNRL